jgi:hypothetical protein
MPAHRLLVTLIAAFAILAFACGSDDDGDKESPSPSAQTSTPDDDETTTPTGDGDDKTPGADETPDGEETPVDGEPTRTAASEGIRAVAPADQPAFLNQFQSEINYEDCQFNPSTVITDCPGHGQYAVDPPLSGQDISCRIGSVEGKAELINCTSQEPLTSIYYDIQE